jgi:hypothetical protein
MGVRLQVIKVDWEDISFPDFFLPCITVAFRKFFRLFTAIAI